MGYYTPDALPFAYSLASTFTVANRWFCSVPGPTYPNRRFLLAGTAYGGTVTGPETLLDRPPPHGTIFDRLSDHHISWCDYFTDVPMTAVIPSIILKHAEPPRPDQQVLPRLPGRNPAGGELRRPRHRRRFLDRPQRWSHCRSPVKEILRVLGANFQDAAPGETEEDPQDMYFGEAWAHSVVEAVLQSPKWSRTLLIYTYDEHGGYYDHVSPPRAIPPDNIPPNLQPGDPPGGYDIYGPRVPGDRRLALLKARRQANDLTYDHTSISATIETKWNLPALTLRDANASTIMDFLDTTEPALLQPPFIATPQRPPGL